MKTKILMKTNNLFAVRVLLETFLVDRLPASPGRVASEFSQAGKTAGLYAGRYQPASSPKEVADFYILNTMGGLRR